MPVSTWSLRPPREAPASLATAWMPDVRGATLLAFCVGLLVYILLSWRWPLIWDMQVLHYVSFLMDRGWAPYRQIGDMNMPGAYLFETWALHLFGSTDLGWRLYDFSLSGALIASMVTIARRYDWLAGLAAGATFALAHGAEGPRNAGQRDQVMAVLLLAGCALCIESVRRRKPWLMLPFGLLVAMAGAIKPTLAVAGPVFLLLAWFELRRRKIAAAAYSLWALGGFAAAAIIVLWFLFSHQAMHAFLLDVTQVLPNYLTLIRTPWPRLIAATLQPPIALFGICAAAIALLQYRARTWIPCWEDALLLAGAFFGLLNFYGQRRGYFQHRYTLLVFILLWAALRVFTALREQGTVRKLGLAALAFLVLFYVPRNLYWIHTWDSFDNFSASLEQEMQTLGPARLQHQVQCLDIVDGCLNALYHLRIVQSTGATGDLLLFLPRQSAVSERARAGFAASIQANPPAVFVVSNWWYGEPRSFRKLEQWPAFDHYLQQNYVLTSQREFPERNPPVACVGSNPKCAAYRIYIRRGSPLLSLALAQQAASTR